MTLGKSLVLTCSAEAVPAPNAYTWFLHKDWKNGTSHSPGWPKETHNNRLEITRVMRADHGCYYCSASNSRGRGQRSSSYCVEVLCKYVPQALGIWVEVRVWVYYLLSYCSYLSYCPSMLLLCDTLMLIPYCTI